MTIKSLAVAMGVGAAAGAVGILMLSKSNPARKLAARAANCVGDAAWRVSSKLTDSMDM